TFTLHPDDLPAFEEAVRTLPGQQSVIPTDGDTLLFLEQDGKLTLECTNVETGKHQRTLPRSRADAEVWIPLQRGYVLQAVKAGFTTWRMQDSLCPIQSDTEDGAIHVLMPMRYEGEAKFPAPGKARQEDQPDPAETPNPQPEPQKEDAMSMNPPEYDPTDAEGQPPDNTVPFPVPEPRQEPESLEDLLVMVQDTRAQVRDLNKSLGDIASFIRSQKKQDKQLRSELSNARGVLEKLRDIAA
ncbi:MAG: hypothetical protein JJU29_01955, partial [Verrucomicrobia bacterium]|nr:hypothetical protein [Verrucomicrobiota bacterium]